MNINKIKKWCVLGGVATALLIIPRRSSQRGDTKHATNSNNKIEHDSNNNISTMKKMNK